jgi:hypothetical protein
MDTPAAQEEPPKRTSDTRKRLRFFHFRTTEESQIVDSTQLFLNISDDPRGDPFSEACT